MAQPGKVTRIGHVLEPPAPLTAAAAGLALTLFDHETAIWLDPPCGEASGAVRWIKFHTGASVTSKSAEAAFALVSDPVRMPALALFAQGTPEFPDRSTTIIMQVETFGDGVPMTLSGPGIASTRKLSVFPLPRNFESELKKNNALFPCGVDIIFAAPDSIAALPRSTRITTEN